jgi:8-oxo-dGTP diphosphatase
MANKSVKKYKYAVIATDTVLFTVIEEKLNVLLIKMKKPPFGNMWAAPGGLVKPDESVDDCAKRILSEKTGIRNVYLEQLYTFGSVKRDPFGRVVSVAYFALVPSDGHQLRTTEEYADVRWFPADKLPSLAYDHREIVKFSIERLRAKLGYTNIVYSLLPKEFTLGEMQAFYEIIFGKALDKRNFRKKILSLKLVKSTGKKDIGRANRPAELYKFIEKTPKNIELL